MTNFELELIALHKENKKLKKVLFWLSDHMRECINDPHKYGYIDELESVIELYKWALKEIWKYEQ